jgi:predicted nucleotidyltransferase
MMIKLNDDTLIREVDVPIKSVEEEENKITAEQKLLDSLEQEEKIPEEPLVLPENLCFNPLWKVAELLTLESNRTLLDPKQLKQLGGEKLLSHLLVHLVEFLNLRDLNTLLEGGERYLLPKAVLADLKKEHFPKGEMGFKLPLPKFSLEVAASLYQHFFQVLCDPIYLQPEKELLKTEYPLTELKNGPKNEPQSDLEVKVEREPADVPSVSKADNQNLDLSSEMFFSYYRGNKVESTLMALLVMPLVRGEVQERLPEVSQIRELRYLIGTKVYYDLIKDKELKEQLRKNILNKACPIDRLFLYSILVLHQDFFKAIKRY